MNFKQRLGRCNSEMAHLTKVLNIYVKKDKYLIIEAEPHTHREWNLLTMASVLLYESPPV